ncbi:conserved protein of unknown function [Tenacibaculum sp. 190524A02b]|uniref:DUF2911 domain-containing protein n=1 Tax=Tenacibaculum vairaonense TaxID=3137860 RepID=UPI0032B27E4B
MKKVLLTLLLFSFFNLSYGQKIKDLDTSPLDFAVFRPDGQGTQPVARIIYSRPQKKNRKIFGELVPYGKVWRTGANQTTEINVYKDITIQGKKLKAGSYTLYTVPNKDSWKVIFNSNLFTWGAYDYDASKNVLEFDVPVKRTSEPVEAFGIAFGKHRAGNGKILFSWDDIEIFVDFNY